jgi:hypothetical protein
MGAPERRKSQRGVVYEAAVEGGDEAAISMPFVSDEPDFLPGHIMTE